MRTISTVVTLAALVALAAIAADAKFITYQNCSSKSCAVGTCTSQTLPADSCLPIGSGYSQALTCVPIAEVCFNNYLFTDAACTKPLGVQNIPCGQCFPSAVQNSSEPWEQINCFIGNDNSISINVNECGKGTSSLNCNCATGPTIINVPTGKCFHDKRRDRYLLLERLATCGAVVQQIFSNADCSGSPVAFNRIASGLCNEGAMLTCNGSF